MAFQNLCPPALIYLIFSITQIVIDTVKGLYNTALIKIWVAFIFTILLNYLCNLGLGIISWFIVFIPFLLMTLVVAILLLMFGLDPATGKIKILDNKKNHKHHKGHHHHKGEHHGRGSTRKKKEEENENNVMDYYNSGAALGGGGGGVSGKNHVIDENETKKDKSNRILKKSLLFYSEGPETDEKKPETKFEEDKNHLDTTKYMLHVDTVSQILATIGENDKAAEYVVKSNKCINEAKKMKKDEAIKSIETCQDDLIKGITNDLQGTPNHDKFLRRMIEILKCDAQEINKSGPVAIEECKKKYRENWWN